MALTKQDNWKLGEDSGTESCGIVTKETEIRLKDWEGETGNENHWKKQGAAGTLKSKVELQKGFGARQKRQLVQN